MSCLQITCFTEIDLFNKKKANLNGVRCMVYGVRCQKTTVNGNSYLHEFRLKKLKRST